MQHRSDRGGIHAQASGRDIPDLRYHATLYHYRMTVLLEGVYQRSLRDPNKPDATGMGDLALANLAQAIEQIDRDPKETMQ